MAKYTLYVDKAGNPAFVQMEEELTPESATELREKFMDIGHLPILGPEWTVVALDIELPERGTDAQI